SMMLRNAISLTACLAALFATGCTAAVEPEPEGDDSATPEETGESSEPLVLNNRIVICAGGLAPVHLYNLTCPVATRQSYLSQGTHGWAQSGGCCDNTCDIYFHPDDGEHGGYIEQWRLCNY